MRLRHACAALSLALPGWAAAGGPAHAEPPAVQALVDTADAALVRGDAAAAQAAFEQAAALEHAARIEVGWVRARLQAGGYRQALAFAAHAAGAHPDEAEGAALYAQLLALGGQEAAAQQVLARARERLPHDPLLVQSPPTPACEPHAAAATPTAMRPMPLGDTPAHNAAVVASGVLLADGRQALVPAGALEGARSVWLRNGLGRSRRADLVRHEASGRIAVLRLRAPLDAPAGLAVAARPAFAGSPAFVVGYRVDTTGRPAWPQLCLGFLAGAPAHGGPRPLGIDVPDGSAGAPVFDSAGRLVGMALPGDTPALLAAQHFGTDVALPASAAAAAALPLDELYERALRVSVQVLRE